MGKTPEAQAELAQVQQLQHKEQEDLVHKMAGSAPALPQ
jgi:hypothetical protein